MTFRFVRICFAVLLMASCAPKPGDLTKPRSPEATSAPEGLRFDGETYLRIAGPKETGKMVRYLRKGETIENFSTWSKMLIIHHFPGTSDFESVSSRYLAEIRAAAQIQGGVFDGDTKQTLIDYALGMRLPNFYSFEAHFMKFFAKDGEVIAYEFLAQKNDKKDGPVAAFIVRELKDTRKKFQEEIRDADWLS